MAAVTLLPSIINGAIHPSDERRDLPRPYKCPLCEKAFHRLEHQTRHIRTHTGEKPHACQFSGCTKRFSRSDELTRHSRIHNNPNSRRSNKLPPPRLYNVLASGSATGSALMPPPTKTFSKSAPPSVVASPVMSPSVSASYRPKMSTNQPRHLPPVSGISAQPAHEVQHLTGMKSHLDGDMSLSLSRIPPSTRHHSTFQTQATMTSHTNRNHLPSVSYLMSSRLHARDDDHYSHRPVKRSRPNSPNSTAPPSPTFSNDSLSPTPDHTPLVTPAHSPRLRPFANSAGLNGYDLPSLRNLSLHPHHTPVLAPMEPQHLDGSYYPHTKSHSFSSPITPRLSNSLTNIFSRPDRCRKLPSPLETRVSIQELVIPSDCNP